MNGAYRFGEYRINSAQRELWRGDERITLPPQVFDFLAYLVEHHDRAVGREEIVAAVWGKTEVSDTLLGQTVLRIRRELGDDAKQQRVLRTIPRFGYRWAAPLEAEPEVVRADVVASPAVPDSPDPVASSTVEIETGVAVARARLRFIRRRRVCGCDRVSLVLGSFA